MSPRRADTALLLDTCTLLDLVSDPDRIADRVRRRLEDLSNTLYVSAATAWEIAIKTRNGRLAGGDRLIAAWDKTLRDLRAELVSIDAEDALRAGGLGWAHRDPFDRMLLAQSLRRNVPLVTRDIVILAAGIAPTIDTRR